MCADCYSASNCIASDDHQGYVEVELSPEMSKLYVPEKHSVAAPSNPMAGEIRLGVVARQPLCGGTTAIGRELKKDEFYVVRIFMSGQKQTVVEREQNILSSQEAQKHEKACTQAMNDEIMRWHTLGAFKRMPRKLATHVIDARWVLKWKLVAGKRIIQSRLVVRGFKDLQAAQLLHLCRHYVQVGTKDCQLCGSPKRVAALHSGRVPSLLERTYVQISCPNQGPGASQHPIHDPAGKRSTIAARLRLRRLQRDRRGTGDVAVRLCLERCFTVVE